MKDFKALYNEATEARALADGAWSDVRVMQDTIEGLQRKLKDAEDEARYRSDVANDLEKELREAASS